MSTPAAAAASTPTRPRPPRGLPKLRESREKSADTVSALEQRAVEDNCLAMFKHFWDRQDEDRSAEYALKLNRDKTMAFLVHSLRSLSPGYSCLDASRPWLVYWILHSLELLDKKTGGRDVLQSPQATSAVVKFLKRCQNPTGGFGGGPGQMSHLAPTYAAVNALAILGTKEAFSAIDRESLANWISSLRQPDGSFTMHVDGEVDIRGVYCALSVAKLTNVYSPKMFENTARWILRCQTYEGGFGGAPGMEAHGGYTFCGLAALVMLEHHRLCREDRLLRWAANRQMKLEGGFQGRTNKLVDGCYSFWQGGMFPLLHGVMAENGKSESLSGERWMFDQESLQEYLLICCQDPRGGLVDKPGKARDLYHTCYTLSGLSVAQNFTWAGASNNRVSGPAGINALVEVHPIHNIGLSAAAKASEYFVDLPVPQNN